MNQREKERTKIYMKPVQRVEISAKRTGLRIAATVICIAVALGSVAYGLSTLLGKKKGWTKIIPEPIEDKHFSVEFLFEYELGRDGESPTAEYRKLSSLYAKLSARAYKAFNSEESFKTSNNIYYLNRHPNEIVVIDNVLYDALKLFEKYNSSLLYLGPIYEQYAGLFSCEEDYEAMDFDPAYNDEIAKYFQKLLGYVNDRNAVSIEFLNGTQVRLNVSEAYLAYAKEEGIKNFIDLFWLQNAFAIDYIADGLIAEGYTHGSIASFDGFSRNLGDVGLQLSSNIFDRTSGSVNAVARMDHKKPINFVYLRDYERTTLDKFHYYQFENGETRTPYIDIRDGKSKAALSDFLAYSAKFGCAEIALQIADIYIADEFNSSAAKPLKDTGVYVVYCIDRTLFYSDSDALLTTFDTDKTFNYKLQPLN